MPTYQNPIIDIGEGGSGNNGNPTDPGLVTNPEPPIEIIRDWVLPGVINFSIVQDQTSTITNNITIGFKDFFADYPPDELEFKFTFEKDPTDNSNFSMVGGIQLNQSYSFVGYYGRIKIIGFKFNNTENLPEGIYDGNLKITAKEVLSGNLVEEKIIPVSLNVIYFGEITTEITEKDMLFCLDQNIITVDSNMGRFVDVFYTVLYKSITYTLKSRLVVFRGECLIDVGKELQPYVFLTEDDINNFFTQKKLDLAPAVVSIKISVLDKYYSEILTAEYSDLLFHAGKSSGVPANNTIIERSLSWNSYLPLAFHYPGENVEFKYKDFSKNYNKQQFSEANHIFQMMFIQQYHFANESGINATFSNGFSSGFATVEALLNAHPFYKYDENYLNYIISSYTVKGINFPWQTNSVNVIWLDDNNIFNGMAFTGHNETNVEFSHFLNDLPENFYNKKAGNTFIKKMKLNTGWKLFSETKYVLDLIKNNRCWIFGNDPIKRVEAVCITDKIQDSSTLKELNEFTLEFIINE